MDERDNGNCYALAGSNGEPGVVQSYAFLVGFYINEDFVIDADSPPPVDVTRATATAIHENKHELLDRIHERAQRQDDQFYSLRLQQLQGVEVLSMSSPVDLYSCMNKQTVCQADTCRPPFRRDDNYSGCEQEGLPLFQNDSLSATSKNKSPVELASLPPQCTCRGYLFEPCKQQLSASQTSVVVKPMRAVAAVIALITVLLVILSRRRPTHGYTLWTNRNDEQQPQVDEEEHSLQLTAIQ